MSALPYHCTVRTAKGLKISDTIWANSAEQAARRIEKAHGGRCVKISDRNKKADNDSGLETAVANGFFKGSKATR